jgi:hypothetical protein
MLAADFSGSKSFIYWIAALAAIGGLGYIPAFKTPSRALLVLMLVVLLLRNGGFFSQLSSALSSAQPLAPTATGGVVLASATQSIAGTPGAGGIDAPPAGEPTAPSGLPVVIAGGGGSTASSAAGAVGGIVKAASSIGSLFGL